MKVDSRKISRPEGISKDFGLNIWSLIDFHKATPTAVDIMSILGDTRTATGAAVYNKACSYQNAGCIAERDATNIVLAHCEALPYGI